MAGGNSASDTAFFTCVCAPEQWSRARLMISSVRAFGGEMSECPFWVAVPEGLQLECNLDGLEDVRPIVLDVPDDVRHYCFARKVYAAGAVEEAVGRACRTLVWLIPESLVARPPSLFRLEGTEAAAIRPVHITNVGLPDGKKPDRFWAGVYDRVGEPDPTFTVESFIEGERIRPYFNSAAYSVDPSLGLLRTWGERFLELAADAAYQREACWDEWHRIFLHQAVLSAVVAVSVPRERIRMLPADYGYPYNLHDRVPRERRADALNGLSCVIYEDRTVDPGRVDDIEIREPLRSWLAERLRGSGGGRDH